MPEQINDYEKAHDKYKSQLTQKVKNIILNSLSVTEKNDVLKKLSRDYNGIIEGNEEAIFEEFVANVLSDMDYTYLGKFAELQKAYWKNNVDFIDNYKVSEYTTGTDAGGIIDNIGLGNDANLGSTNQLYISADEYAVVSQAIMSKNAGVLDKELKPYDFVYSANNFYIYKNHSLGDFSIIKKVDIENNKELIREIIGEIKNGTNRGTESFNSRAERIRGGKRSNSGYNGSIERTDTHRNDDRLSFGKQRSNTIRHSLGGGIYHSDDYVKYSFDNSELTDYEWSEFYRSLGELKRGMWFPVTADGDYVFETYDKLIFADGNYENPIINSVVVFENLSAEEIEYGKEIAYYAAQRGENSKECYEAVRDMLGQKNVTRTNPHSYQTYQRSRINNGKGKYSFEVDNGIDGKIKYSLDSAETDTAELTPERQKEIFEQFEKDRAGVPKPSKISQWGERAAWVAHNMTRVFPNIPERGERGTFFAEFRKSMIQWKNLLATVLCCLMPV